MTRADVPALLERLGFPFAYDHFAEGEGPDPPFLVYRYPKADNFAADGVAYFKQDVLHIEVYTCLLYTRIYRLKFHRDIYKDLAALEKSVGENTENGSRLDMFSLEMFENIAYIMAKHADPAAVPDSPEDWLDSFNTFSIYQVLPQLIELWGLNVQTDVQAKKNFARLTGK